MLPVSCTGACLILSGGGRGKPRLLAEVGDQDRWTGCCGWRGVLISTLVRGLGVLWVRGLLLQPPPGLLGGEQAAQEYRGVAQEA